MLASVGLERRRMSAERAWRIGRGRSTVASPDRGTCGSLAGMLFGGYHGARLVHFVAMCGLLSFIPGHLLMVALHGWDNLRSMVTGWKHRPDYLALRAESAAGRSARAGNIGAAPGD